MIFEHINKQIRAELYLVIFQRY